MEKVITQEIVDAIFYITIAIYEDPWFKCKARTRDEVQQWVADKLAIFEIYTMPIGSCWGSLISKERYDEYIRKRNKDI